MVASQHDFPGIRGHKVELDKDNSCAKRQICEAISIAWFCSSPFRKNKSLPFFRNRAYIRSIPPPLKRGVATVTDVGSGERWTRGLALDERLAIADGEAAWSWPPDAEVKFANDEFAGDGD